MPDTQPTEKNSGQSSASATSFNKTLSALTGTKNLGAPGTGGGGGGGGGGSGGGLTVGAPGGSASLALGAFGAKLTAPGGANGPVAAAAPAPASAASTAAPPPQSSPSLAPAKAGGGGGGMAALFGGGGGGGKGGLLGVTSALQQQQQQPPPQPQPSPTHASVNNVATSANDVAVSNSNNNNGTSSNNSNAIVANSNNANNITNNPVVANSLPTPAPTPAPPVHQVSVPHIRMSSSGAPAATADDVIAVTETLIDAIGRGDYDTWKRMTSHDLTCFEPESQGCLVEGREFHKYYFDLGINEKSKTFRVNLIAPRVHLLGPDAGVIGYVLLTQFVDKAGVPQSRQCEESRVWRRDRDGLWRCVHIHRSSYTPQYQAPSPINSQLVIS